MCWGKGLQSLKAGKSPVVDNIPSELPKNGGEATTTVLTAICQKIWKIQEWHKEWTQLLVISLPKRGNFKQSQNYCTISLLSHPSMILLQVIINWLKAKAGELLAEEEAGFRPGQNTVEQIFYGQVTIECNLFCNFIDFKKVFDRAWHAGLSQAFRSFNIHVGPVQAI